MTSVMVNLAGNLAFRATRTNETLDQVLRSNKDDFGGFALGNFLALTTFLAGLDALGSGLRFDFCDYGIDVDDEENDHVLLAGKFPSQCRHVRVTFRVICRAPPETLVRLGSRAVNGWM